MILIEYHNNQLWNVFMITREADYALRVVLSLADIPKGQSFSTAALAEQMNIPYRFLRRILRKFCVSGLVGSVRGKEGGVYLLEKPSKIAEMNSSK